mgnify:CR=1 FL=1
MGWERTLVFVAGATPQIITETVWALCQEGRPVPKTQIFALTTTAGRDHIRRALFGRGGKWAALRRTWPAARKFSFRLEDVKLIPGPHGEPLEDVRSTNDSTAAGNFIMDFVRTHTQPGSPPLHASIAGGRKTMGYLLATAMMLYGRVDDELSHVLVRPPEIEATDFFFPPRSGKLVRIKTSSGEVRSVSRNDIHIDLAPLPFPRLRLLSQHGDLDAESFAELVERLQDRLLQFVRPEIEVDVSQHRLSCGGEDIEISPLRAGIYALLALRRKVHPAGTPCPGCERCFVSAAEVSTSLKKRLRELMSSVESVAVGPNWSERNFRPEISKLNKTLKRKLGAASAPYEVQIRGERRHRLYGVGAAPELLHVRGLPPTVGGNVA